MAYKSYYFTLDKPKQPSEKFPIDVDFALDLVSGETITDETVTAINLADDSDASSILLNGDAQIQNGDATLSKVVQGIKGGIDGNIYKVSILVTTSDSNEYEADIEIIVENL